jgi:hypothetical protein
VTTTFASANDLASAFRRAAAAHDEHEKRIGQADPNWPNWYDEYMVREQSGHFPIWGVAFTNGATGSEQHSPKPLNRNRIRSTLGIT